MAEDERAVERTDDEAASVDAPADTGQERDAVLDDISADDAAESFLDLEADLDGRDESGGPLAEGERGRALVTNADRVDEAAVPEGYPLEPETDEVLALTLDIGDAETTAFLDWPAGDEASPLRRLLAAMDVQLGDLFGRRLLVERTGRHYAVVTPDEEPRSSGDWGLGVLAGIGLTAAVTGLLAVTGGASIALGLLWVALSAGALPLSTYKDAWYLRTHSDWRGGPLFWAALSTLPFVNLLAAVAYLWQRRRATFFAEEPSLPTRLARLVG